MVRPAERASCPRASSTWEGALLAELQAEVAENAIECAQRRGIELAFIEGQAQGMGNALGRAAIETNAGKAAQLFKQALAQRDDGGFLFVERCAANAKATPMAAI